MARILLSILLVLGAGIGCAKKDDLGESAGTNTTASQGKNLFSRWVDETGFYSIDLSQASLGKPSKMEVAAVTGQKCSCQIVMNGNQTQGTTNITSCSGDIPDCATFNGAGQYTKSDTTLEICESQNSCLTLK